MGRTVLHSLMSWLVSRDAFLPDAELLICNEQRHDHDAFIDRPCGPVFHALTFYLPYR
jgi:hypothetical protein